MKDLEKDGWEYHSSHYSPVMAQAVAGTLRADNPNYMTKVLEQESLRDIDSPRFHVYQRKVKHG